MRLFYEIPICQTVKSKFIISLFETERLSVSISLRNLHFIKKYIKKNTNFVLVSSASTVSYRFNDMLFQIYSHFALIDNLSITLTR